MDKKLIKTFLTILVLTIGAFLETLSTNLINEHDDLISLLGLIASLGIILLMIYALYKIWLTTKKNKTKIK